MTRFNVLFDHNCPPAMSRMLAGFLSYAKSSPLSVALSNVMTSKATDVEWIGWLNEQPGG